MSDENMTPKDGWDCDEEEVAEALAREFKSLRARYRLAPPVEILRAEGAGVLPEDLDDAARRHLASDALSRAVVASLAATPPSLDEDDHARLRRRIERAAGEDRPAGRNIRRWLRVSALAAATLAVIVVGWVTWRDARSAPTPPGASTSVADGAAAGTRALLPLDPPAVRLSMGSLTWRNARPEDSFLVDLRPGLDAFRAADYVTASMEFSTLANEYPEAVEVHYYQGVARLFLGQARDAVSRLETAQRLADASLAADVAWYLAIAYERTGDVEASRRQLRGLCDGGSARAAEACDFVRKLD